MTLQVIGAGYGRTGTHSLYLALGKLGYRTHHMVELVSDFTQDSGVWLRAYRDPKHEDEWEKVYGKYDAAVDIPTCVFYKELSERYPEAKVILTVRSADSWYKSVSNTFYKTIHDDFSGIPDHNQKVKAMANEIMMNGALIGNPGFKDKEKMCAMFDQHNAEVIKTIPADRLLVLELGDGWEKLCQFLGKDVPDEPYPVSNSTSDFAKLFSYRSRSEERQYIESIL